MGIRWLNHVPKRIIEGVSSVYNTEKPHLLIVPSYFSRSLSEQLRLEPEIFPNPYMMPHTKVITHRKTI